MRAGRAAGGPPRPPVRHHQARPAGGAAAGPGQPGLHRRRAEPAVDRRLHLRADLVGDGVHRVRLRRVLPPHRRLAHRRIDADRAAAGRAGDGAVDPRPRRPRDDGRLDGLIHHSDAGSPVHRDPLRRPARRRRRARLDRHRRRHLRQRHGRVGDRALQDRMRPPRRPVPHRRRSRAGHPVAGCTGSTPTGCTALWTTSPRSSTRPTYYRQINPRQQPLPGEPALH